MKNVLTHLAVFALAFVLSNPTHAQMTQNQFADFVAGRSVVTPQQAHDCQQVGNVMATVVASRDAGETESSWKKATIVQTFGGTQYKLSLWQYAGIRKDTFLYLVHDAYQHKELSPNDARYAYNMECRAVMEKMNHQPVDLTGEK